MSLQRHVFITGPPGVGKTTLVKKICRRLTEEGGGGTGEVQAVVTGFYTEEVRQNGGRRIGFDVVALDGSGARAALARIEADGRGPKVGNYTVRLADFERVALDCLEKYTPKSQSGRCQFLVIDEVGKMELFSKRFTEKVASLFESETSRIICTLPISRGKPLPLVETLKKRPDAVTFSVTAENRDSLLETIYSHIQSL